jgi:acyl-CoA thioester hydrolase
MSHRIYSLSQKAVAAEGESVIVMFDYTHQRPVLVADDIRRRVEELEKKERAS